ncbi:PilZ domain-containing protein [Rhizobium helianthi]|uniref:PilZ domain-containing protein n=1 Tax=Rhizobium helianthi TaxID=1132695 RepID=A0ABW4M5N5_9HYPH
MPLNVHTDGKSNTPRDQAFPKYTIDRPGKIIFVGRHLSTKTHFRCLVRSISLSGAQLDVSPYLPLPKNFFLEILGVRDEIGCTVIRREEEQVTVGFNMLLAPEFVHHVLKLSFDAGLV